MKTRLIHEVGTRASLRVYWGGGGESDPRNDVCPNAHGRGTPGYHNAETPLTTTEKIGDWDLGGKPEDYPDARWPAKCDHCGAAVPAGVPIDPPASSWVDDPNAERGFRYQSVVNRQVFRNRLYDTASGSPEPGDVYRMSWHGACGWSNCQGEHLHVVLPNGWDWDVMSRCSNCGSPEDKTHRCWVLREEAPGVFHVDKTGHTCSAGAGSIAAPGFHGFLHHGEIVSC